MAIYLDFDCKYTLFFLLLQAFRTFSVILRVVFGNYSVILGVKNRNYSFFGGHKKAPCMTCILSDTEAQRVFMYSIPDSDLSPVHDLINIFSVPILGRFLWFSVPILGIMTSSQPLFVRHCLFRKTLNYSFFPTFLLLFLHNWKISCIFALEII